MGARRLDLSFDTPFHLSKREKDKETAIAGRPFIFFVSIST